MLRGMGKLRAKKAGGGAGPAVTLRAATNINYLPSAFNVTSAGQLTQISRVGFRIGSGNMSQLRVSFMNFIVTAAGCTLNTNGYQVLKCAIEKEGGVTVPVTFSGGRTLSVLTSSTDLQSDALLPAAFGGGSFARDDLYWLRLQVVVTTAGHQLPYGVAYNGPRGGTFPAWVGWAYDPTVNTTVSDVDSTGNISLGTGVGAGVNNPVTPIILGAFTAGDPKTFGGFGDSIMDASADGLTGFGIGGYFQRALSDATFAASVLGGIDFGCSGSRPQMWSGPNIAQATAYIKYCKYGVDNYITNNIFLGDSLATCQSQAQSMWTIMRAGGITEIIQVPCLPRTSSTDSWATELNQTPLANFTTVGIMGQFNTWLITQIGGAGISSIASITPLLGIDVQKWIVTGAANYATADGTHPGTQGHLLEAVPIRTGISALP